MVRLKQFICKSLCVGISTLSFLSLSSGCSTVSGKLGMERAKESEIERLDIKKLQGYIEEGHSNIQENLEESILVIGNTGSGKSTLINVLLGNQLEVTRVGMRFSINLKEGQEGPKIGNKAATSETSLPKLWKNQLAKVAYWDCPGFEDNRSTEQDIANAFYINKILESSKRIKILLLIGSDDIVKKRAIGLLRLIEILGNMFNNVEDILNGLSLLVTQVERDMTIKNVADELKVILEERLRLTDFPHQEKVFLQYAISINRLQIIHSIGNEEDMHSIKGSVFSVVSDAHFIKPPKSTHPPISSKSEKILQRFLKDTENTLDILSDNLYKSIGAFVEKELVEDEFQSIRFLTRFYNLVQEILSTREEVSSGNFKDYYKAIDRVASLTGVNYESVSTLEVAKFAGSILSHDFINILKHTHKPFDDLELLLAKQITLHSTKLEKRYKHQMDSLLIRLTDYIETSKEDGGDEKLTDLYRRLEKLVLLDDIAAIDFATQLEDVLGSETLSVIRLLHNQILGVNEELLQLKKPEVNLSYKNLMNRIFPMMLMLKDRKMMTMSAHVDKKIKTISDNAKEMQRLMEVALVPLGCIIMCPYDKEMVGFFDCDGRALSRVEYTPLFSLIGIRYGGGDGINTFNIPNLLGRSLVGCNQGGNTNGIITKTGNSLGNIGGSEIHTLSENEMPQHNHLMDYNGDHSHIVGELKDSKHYAIHQTFPGWTTNIEDNDPPLFANGTYSRGTTTNGNHAHGIHYAGGSQPHNNMPPFMLGRYLIRVK